MMHLQVLQQPKNYSYLNSNGETGNTPSKINEFLKSLEVNQVLTKRRCDISFVAEGPLEQFRIDLVYMPKTWFSNGYKYIICSIDVFSKKKQEMIPYILTKDQNLKMLLSKVIGQI